MESEFRTLDEFASLRTNTGNDRIDCRDYQSQFPGKVCDSQFQEPSLETMTQNMIQ